MQTIIKIENGITRMPEWRMAEPVNFEACEGEHIAIVGPNGGGERFGDREWRKPNRVWLSA